MLNQWEPKIAEGLTNSGLPVAAGDGIAKALTGVLAGGVGYAAGGMAGAVSGVNEDFNNRQLQETEKQLAKFLADKSDGKFTAKQIEDQLRAASRAMPGKKVENPSDGIVLTGVGSGQNAPVYTTRIVDGTGWVNNGTVVYQPVPTIDREIIAYIADSLGGYSPYSWSLPIRPTVSNENPFSLNWNNGQYSAGLTNYRNDPYRDTSNWRQEVATGASVASQLSSGLSTAATFYTAVPGPHQPYAGAIALWAGAATFVLDGVVYMATPQKNSGKYMMDLAWDTMGAVIDGRYPLFCPSR